jgi:oligoribonuclease NrnB/cAMP/cGMP phosphodiesterase (DHH superfamily)
VIKLGRRPTKEKYRLVTRSDFDGLVCAALLKELEMLDDILFVHPKDMQDGKVEITERDITTNLPYVPTAYLSFDHHSSEADRIENGKPNHVMVAGADSAARVVYDYFGGAERSRTCPRR